MCVFQNGLSVSLVSQPVSYKVTYPAFQDQLRLRRLKLRGAHSKHLWYSSLSACINVYHLICLKGMPLYKQGPVCTSVFLEHLTWEELSLVGLGTERKCSITMRKPLWIHTSWPFYAGESERNNQELVGRKLWAVWQWYKFVNSIGQLCPLSSHHSDPTLNSTPVLLHLPENILNVFGFIWVELQSIETIVHEESLRCPSLS